MCAYMQGSEQINEETDADTRTTTTTSTTVNRSSASTCDNNSNNTNSNSNNTNVAPDYGLVGVKMRAPGLGKLHGLI